MHLLELEKLKKEDKIGDVPDDGRIYCDVSPNHDGYDCQGEQHLQERCTGSSGETTTIEFE